MQIKTTFEKIVTPEFQEAKKRLGRQHLPWTIKIRLLKANETLDENFKHYRELMEELQRSCAALDADGNLIFVDPMQSQFKLDESLFKKLADEMKQINALPVEFTFELITIADLEGLKPRRDEDDLTANDMTALNNILISI